MPRQRTLREEELVEVVQSEIKEQVLTEMFNFLERQQLNLWGAYKAKSDFLFIMMITTLYADKKGIGEQKLLKKIRNLAQISLTSLQRNMYLIRKALSQWGQEHIILGDASQWRAVARGAVSDPEVKDANLWMDSVDFRLKGRRLKKKKDPSWSYKEDSPAQRYMVLSDASSRIRYVWGGYPPKLFDGDFIRINRHWIEENLKGGNVLADGHFTVAKKLFKGVKFYVPFPEVTYNDGSGNKVLKLTKEQQKFNKAVKAARSRVESPFGLMKQNWKSLSKPWYRDEKCQNFLVTYIIGIHNASLAYK